MDCDLGTETKAALQIGVWVAEVPLQVLAAGASLEVWFELDYRLEFLVAAGREVV
jgi:hypothetical protein